MRIIQFARSTVNNQLHQFIFNNFETSIAIQLTMADIAADQVTSLAGSIIDGWNKIASKGTGSHTLSVGKPGKSDVVLYEEDYRKGSEFLSSVQHTFSYNCQGGERITAVVARDMWTDDTGGTPELVSGGVGQNAVSVQVTSRFSRGFHFKFVVYGSKK